MYMISTWWIVSRSIISRPLIPEIMLTSAYRAALYGQPAISAPASPRSTVIILLGVRQQDTIVARHFSIGVPMNIARGQSQQ